MNNLSMEWKRKIYDTFMLNHVWLDYIVMENKEIKKKFFGVQRAPRWGHVGHPCGARWTAQSRLGKNSQKKKKFYWTSNNKNTEWLYETSIPIFNISHIISSLKTSRAQITKKKKNSSSSKTVKQESFLKKNLRRLFSERCSMGGVLSHHVNQVIIF